MAKTIVTVDQGGTGAETASAALTALGAAPSAFTQTGTGAVATTVDAKLKESVSVKDFGATGDGATDDTVKIQAAIDAFDNVLIPKGTYVLGADLTLDAGKTLSFLDGGIISVSSTKTLTINGCIDAGLYKIFEGSGTIRINPGETQEVVASWWGASPSATASVNTTAIQASIDALGTTVATTPIQTHNFTWRLPSGFYEIDAEIEFKTEIHYGKIFFDGVVQQTTSSANGIKFNNVHYSDINITKIIAEHYYGLGTRTSGSGVILDGYFDHSNLDMANGSGRIHGFEKGIYWSNKDDDCSLGYSSFTLGHIQHCHYGVYAVLQSNDGNSWMNTNIFRKGQISPAGAIYTNGSATPSISAITQASPGVITTSTAHGLSVDEDVIITGVVGMTEINCDTDIYLVNSVPSTTTFTLKQLDGHGPSATAVDTSAFTAYASGGVVSRGTYGIVFKDQITGAGGFGRTNRFEFQTLEVLAKGYDLRSMSGCVVDSPYMEANLFDADLRVTKDMTWISGMNDWASGKHITDSNTESLNVLSPSNDTVHEGDLILGTKGINFDTYGGAGNTTDRGHINYYPTYWTFAGTGGGATSYMNKGIEGGTSEPTSGSYRKGAIVWNTASIATGTSSGFMCKTYGTAGTLSGVTGTSVSSSDILTVNSVDNLSLYDNITIAGVSGTKTITAINAQTKKVTLSSAANATVSGAAVSYYNPTWQELVPYGTGVSKVGTPVDNSVGVWTGDGTIEGATGLVFDSTGLGIGTDLPAAKIHSDKTGLTADTVTEVARIQGTVTGGGTKTYLSISSAVSASPVENRYIDLSAFDHNPTARALCFQTAGGSVGVGTTAPGAKLGVVGAIHTFGTGVTPGTAAGVQLAASNSSNDGYLWNFENADFLFGTNNVERLRIADGGRVTVKKSSNSEITALTSSTSITPDMDDANNFSLTLDHDTTLNDPSNMTAGQSGCIVITQGSTGGTCSIYGTKWHFEGGTTPTLSTLAGEVDTLVYYVASTSSIQAVLLKDIKTT